jgi:tetratricopeptide (TPR) repeat protein
MNRKTTSMLLLAATVLLGVAGMGCQKLKARDELNKGVQAFRGGAYPVAVDHFKLSVSLDPTNPTSRAYLATSYMMQYIPGAESEENLRMAEAAHSEFLKVLEQDPKNTNAMAAIAQLYFNEKKFDEALDWYKKLIAVKPDEKTAYYTIGVIAWTKTFSPRMRARAELGMRPEDPGPLKDKKVRDQLKAENMPIIDEGMTALKKAVSLDPEYEDAMAYLNLLYRERADLSDTAEAYKADTTEADSWVEKTLATKKLKAARTPKAAGGLTSGN